MDLGLPGRLTMGRCRAGWRSGATRWRSAMKRGLCPHQFAKARHRTIADRFGRLRGHIPPGRPVPPVVTTRQHCSSSTSRDRVASIWSRSSGIT